MGRSRSMSEAMLILLFLMFFLSNQDIERILSIFPWQMSRRKYEEDTHYVKSLSIAFEQKIFLKNSKNYRSDENHILNSHYYYRYILNSD